MRSVFAAISLACFLTFANAESSRPISPFMNQMAAQLLEEVLGMLEVTEPQKVPQIQLATIQQLRDRYCPNSNCPVLAVYDLNTKVIYLLDTMRYDQPIFVSVVVHELVHHVQHHHGWFEELSDCEKWASRETQAYAIQNQWLGAHGYRRFSIVNLRDQCN